MATYTGDVVVTQGSLKVTGNTVTITRSADGSVDVITSVGNLAYLESQARADSPEKIKCWGLTIQYQTQKDLYVVTDRTMAETPDGKTHDDEKIVVNLQTMVAVATGGAAPAAPRPRIDSKWAVR